VLTAPDLTRAALVAWVEAFLKGGVDGGTEPYGVSKAALNALSRVQAAALAGRGIKVNAVSPGWVRTDMGGRNAPRSVEQGAASVLWGVHLTPEGPTGGVFCDGKRTE
jgi:NAD(P)-dependent dehydrogenase (short-subunit alcohol dehydrogenase family)